VPVLVLALALEACHGGERTARQRFVSIGTAGTGGVYYPLGGAIAARLSVADPDRRYSAEVTGGSVENVNRVAKGETDLGFSMAPTIYEAFNGGAHYPRPLSNLRIVAPLYPNVTHLLVRRGLSARSVADFKGLRVSVGAPGSGTEELSRQLLEVYGITYDMISVRYLSFIESSDALKDGAIDAAIISAGYPASAVLEALTARAARLLPVEEDYREALKRRYPYYVDGVIPRGAYPGVDRDIPTVAVMNWIVGTESLDAGVVRILLDILERDREALIQAHDIARQIQLAALAAAPIPLHPETARWLVARTGSR
jgi:TRAP transporter TAXI family solute receptor